jgi:hypothetical protein
MDNLFSSLLNYLTDKTRSFGKKTTFALSLLGAILLIDGIFNFSFDYVVNNKLSQLESISRLKGIYATNQDKLRSLEILENEVLSRGHYKEYFNRINLTKFNLKNPKDLSSQKNLSVFWSSFTSNYSLFLTLPFLLFLPLFPNQKDQKNFFIGWIALLVMWISFIVLITWFVLSIPVILNKPVINYISYFIAHTALILIFVSLFKEKGKE